MLEVAWDEALEKQNKPIRVRIRVIFLSYMNMHSTLFDRSIEKSMNITYASRLIRNGRVLTLRAIQCLNIHCEQRVRGSSPELGPVRVAGSIRRA